MTLRWLMGQGCCTPLLYCQTLTLTELTRRRGIGFRTQGLKINRLDRSLTVPDRAGYLDALQVMTAGRCLFHAVKASG